MPALSWSLLSAMSALDNPSPTLHLSVPENYMSAPGELPV